MEEHTKVNILAIAAKFITEQTQIETFKKKLTLLLETYQTMTKLFDQEDSES